MPSPDAQSSTCHQMVMTSVTGHVCETDFPVEFSNWTSNEPQVLFEAPIVEQVSERNKSIQLNLQIEARKASMLIIWTDCDREGEYSGWEIAQICLKANPRIRVWRARYSVVSERELKRAFSNLLPLDQRQIDAVSLRMELDLRGGAALTRFLTLFLQERFALEVQKKVISYGSCQFPTLGFVVEQYLRREKFVPEEFYSLHLVLCKERVKIQCSWQRHRLFDLVSTSILHRMALEVAERQTNCALVQEFSSKATSKRKPLPLTTIELQKFCTSYFKIPSHRVAKISEDLYNRGLISYPRTETDIYDSTFPFAEYLSIQTTHPEWGFHAERILTAGIVPPRKGTRDDKAHPPIHPTMMTADLSGEEKKIYEFISRRFLACCAEDAKGFEKSVKFSLDMEIFTAKGLTVTARNYLDLYPYDKWESNQIPDFAIGESVPIHKLSLDKGTTTAPMLLTESQLIATMDRNGIGTDATIHEHIKKILEREYAILRPDHRFEPTPLGLALVVGHDEICPDRASLSKPFLRASLERCMKEIERGSRQKSEALASLLESFVATFDQIVRNKHKLEEAFVKYASEGLNRMGNGIETSTSTSSRNSTERQSTNQNTSQRASNRRNGFAEGPERKKPKISKKPTKEEPNCACGNPALRLCTTKYAEPRFFFKCAASSCSFFEWEDAEPSNTNSRRENLGSNRKIERKMGSNAVGNTFKPAIVNNSNNNAQSSNAPKCECGLEAKYLQSKTERSCGRYFYSCSKQFQRCKYFEWAEAATE